METDSGYTPDFDRLVVIFSDIEMGSGGDLDDFPHSAFLGEVLLSCLEGPGRDRPIHFVFNGDTFDLLKTKYLGGHPRHIDKNVAAAKMSSVAAAHPKFFEALTTILEDPKEERRVYFVTGNHDAELLFPKVQNLIRSLCGDNGRILFPGYEMTLGPVRIEHGSQLDPLFRIDTKRPFLDYGGKEILNLSWATIALLDVILPLQPTLYFYDRLRPRSDVMERLPEVKELLTTLAWRYWTKDFWRDFISLKDPLIRINWSMIKEIVKRMTTSNPSVSIDMRWLSNVVEKSPCELFVTGHLHKMSGYHHKNKRIVQSGCFRDEYFILDEGRGFQPALKNFHEIYLKEDRVSGIMCKEIRGPDRPPEAFPDSIYDVVPRVKALLDNLGDRSRDKENQRKQELKEGEKTDVEDVVSG